MKGSLLLVTIALFFVFQTCNANESIAGTVYQLHQQAPELPLNALQTGVKGYETASKQGDIHNPYLAIADMALPSSQKRLWVFNMKQKSLQYHALVAHGKASGALYATHFSNQRNSDATSLGFYITGKSYNGNDGLSMRLKGEDKGYDNNAYGRNVVMHGASYVSQGFLNKYHRLGRSWGCPAVSKQMVKPLVNTLKDGAMLMIYYPNKNWLQHSRFLSAVS